MKHADRVYRNRADDARVRVYRHESGEGWDFDLFRRHAGNGWRVHGAFLSSAGESPAQTLKSVLVWAEDLIGKIFPINPRGTVTEGWPDRSEASKRRDRATTRRRSLVRSEPRGASS